MRPEVMNDENNCVIGSKRAEETSTEKLDRNVSPLSDSLRRNLNDYHFPDSPNNHDLFSQTSSSQRLVKERKSYIPNIQKPDIVAQVSGFENSVISMMDPRSWLEVLDPQHRYSKHLRIYHRAWSDLGEPLGDFFYWLEHSTHEVPDCPRVMLDEDIVYYCKDCEVGKYELSIDVHTGLFYNVHTRDLVNTGDKGWIFVLNHGVISAAPKRTATPRFHHSSFYAGGCVEVAGIIVVGNGRLVRLYPHSGHYRPTEEHVKHFLLYLAANGVELASFEVDVQHMMKISRPYAGDGSRLKKRECPYYMSGFDVLNFLNVKLRSESVLKSINLRNYIQESGEDEEGEGDNEFKEEETESNDEESGEDCVGVGGGGGVVVT